MDLNKFLKRNKIEIKWQSIIYGVYFCLGLIQSFSEHPSKGILLSEFIGVLNVTVSECTLVNVLGNWLMVRYPYSKSPRQYLFYLLCIIACFIFYRFLTSYPNHVDVLQSYNGQIDKKSPTFFVFISTINFVISYLVALGLYSIKKSVKMEHKANRLEREVNEAKLNMLKHQINPHFLYNTLSYMHSQARPFSENLSKSILMLSDMMRYSLNKTGKNGLVPIEREIEYIENFIEIHRLRFDVNFYLNFEIEGITGHKKIAPLLLITFVENAIKHGRLNDKLNPIKIKLVIDKQYLIFTVKNQKQLGRKDDASGIGLANTGNRLELLYPNRYQLILNDEKNSFEIELKIEFDS
jgi:two-component system, LytTR family, sensor kinase